MDAANRALVGNDPELLDGSKGLAVLEAVQREQFVELVAFERRWRLENRWIERTALQGKFMLPSVRLRAQAPSFVRVSVQAGNPQPVRDGVEGGSQNNGIVVPDGKRFEDLQVA